MALLSGQNLNSLADEFPGVNAVTMPRRNVVALTAGTSGQPVGTLITLPPGLPVNNLDFWQVGAATTPTHQWMCLLAPGGQVLAVTGDLLGAGQAANTYYRAPVLGGAGFVTPPGAPSLYYLVVGLAATTMGTVGGGVASPVVAGPAGTLPAFVTCGTGFSGPATLGLSLTLTAAAGTSANIYGGAA